MENKEFEFSGKTFNGFAMLFWIFVMLAVGVLAIIAGVNEVDDFLSGFETGAGVGVLLLALIFFFGFIELEPGEARVMMFFGKYRGTFTKTGFF